MTNDIDQPIADDSRTEFGLTAPGEFGNDATRINQDAPQADNPAKKKATGEGGGGFGDDDESAGGGGAWKGFEDDEVDPDPGLDFGSGKSIPEDELDMTPMVDVTFLLLIFFMVTASFTLRKSFEQAHSKIDDPSNNVVDSEDEDDFVEVIIDQTNTFYIRTRDTEEIEAPSDREMRDVLREAKEIAGAKRLIIRAHVDALHNKVVKVLDTGNSIGMEQIETVVTETDY